MGKRYAIILGLPYGDKRHYSHQNNFIVARNSSDYFNSYFTENYDSNFEIFYPSPEEAKSTYLKDKLIHLKNEIREGDLLVIYFCGHTYQMKPQFSKEGLLYADRQDEGWGLYDRIMFHFEIWDLLEDYAAGSRIVVLSDSCYSGAAGFPTGADVVVNNGSGNNNYTKLPICIKNDLGMYNTIMVNARYCMVHDVSPSVIVIGACGENSKILPEYSPTDRTHFAEAFKRSVEVDVPPKNLSDLYDRILANIFKMHPNYTKEPNRKGNRAIPQWHYYQGHKFTGIRTQAPIFKNKNL